MRHLSIIRHHSLVFALSVLFGPCLLSVTAAAQTTFSSQKIIDASFSRVSALSVGPLDGDDFPDVFALADESNLIKVAFNGGDGTSWSSMDLQNGDRPRQTSLGDLDGDGDIDLVYTDYNSKRVYLLKNRLDETGDFSRETIAGGDEGHPDGVMVVDMDLDTDLDVLHRRGNGRHLWHENLDGSGSSWASHTIGSDFRGGRAVWAGDMDGDGDIDVAGGTVDGDGQLIWFENTDGAATTWSAQPIAIGKITSLAGGDIDRDGDIDLLVNEYRSDSQPEHMVIWYENAAGDGSIWTEHAIGIAGTRTSIGAHLADVDRDGDLDATGSHGGVWFENANGDGSSWTEHPYGLDDIYDFDAVDADGDGDLDFFAALRGGNRLAWWENLKCDPADPDADGDGYVDGCDLCPGGDDAVDEDGNLVPDDCQTRSIAIDNVSLDEGTGGTTDFVFTVTLTGNSPAPFTVAYSTQPLSATADDDYTSSSGTLSFAGNDGETQTITVSVTGDTVTEPDESFTIELGTPSNPGTMVTDSSGLGSIGNDDHAGLAIDDVAAAEGDAPGTTDFVFTVTLDGPVQDGVAVDYATTNGTATAGSDYVATSGTLTFDGSMSATQTVTVTVVGDDVVEDDETFMVVLTNVSHPDVTLADAIGDGTLQNDDNASLTINDPTVVEGADGTTTNLIFTVTLSGNVDDGFTVPFQTADRSATAGEDYTSTAGHLSFDGFNGESETVTVTILGDDEVEADETLDVQLGAPSKGAVLVPDPTGLGTLENDDTASLSIDDPTVVEGDDGTTTDLVFTVTLSGALDHGFTVSFQTANGSASAGQDYTATSGDLAFDGTDGETETVTVTILGDDVVEADETVRVQLGTPSDGDVVVPDPIGLGTLENDDNASLSIDDPTVVEGDGGTSTQLVFTVTLSGNVDDGFNVPFQTADGSATAGEDYTATSGDLVFGGFDGETETVTVTLFGDDVVEADETLNLQLGTPSNDDILVPDPTGLGTVENDDTASLSIDDPTVVEGDDASTNLVFTVTLAGALDHGFTVPFQTANGSAMAGEDYTATSGELAFTGADGETEIVSVTILGDHVVEADETFDVQLGMPSDESVLVPDPTGTGTLENDDNATLAIADFAAAEGDSGTVEFTFTVTLTGELNEGFTVDFTTADGSATTADGDYQATSGTLTFDGSDGEEETVIVLVNGDTEPEDDETFTVELDAPSSARVTLDDGTGEGLVADDDLLFLLTLTVSGSGYVTSDPAGIDCGDGGTDCEQVYAADTVVELTPTPIEGWVFADWSGDTDCQNGTVIMNGDRDCVATFVQGEAQLDVDFAGDGFGVITSTPSGIECDRDGDPSDCSAIFDPGTTVDLVIQVTSVDTTFDGWIGDADCDDGSVDLGTAGETVTCVAMLTVTPIFADGFESGDTFIWSSTTP